VTTQWEFERPWSPGDVSEREDDHLVRYHERRGGLLFSEVNVAHPVPGSRQRRLDGVLFPDPPEGLDGDAYHYTPSNRAGIRDLLRDRTAELIEVHAWGFYGFGQLVGKAAIVENEWNPEAVQKVFIPDNDGRSPYYPDENPDPATEAVFDQFDVDVVVVK
jgi:hypothetical protein